MKNKRNWSPFFQLMKETKPPMLLMILSLSLSICTTLVGLCVPLFTKGLINHPSIHSIGAGKIGLLVGAIFVQALVNGISIYLLNRIGQSVVAGIRERLWKKLLFLPVSYFDHHQTGEMVSRMTNDTGVIKNLITDQLSGFITGIISIIGSLLVLFLLDWKMTLLMLIAIPLTAAIIIPLGRKMHLISKGMQDETANFTSVLDQVLSEIRLVKASNAEIKEFENGAKGIRQLFRFGLKEAKVQALIGPLVSLIIMVLLVVILGYGGMRVSSGELTAGDLVAFIMYLFQIVMPMGQLTMFFTQFQKAIGATERIIEIMNLEKEEDLSNQEVLDVNQPITIQQMSFSYKNGENVLQNLSFEIEPGKVTAIVGPSGSGKTTLFALLERFYQSQTGKIMLGKESISEYGLSSWRKQIGYVSQESSLVSGTIRDNICYGMTRMVSDEELKQVTRMAYIDEFVYSLPEGFNTEVGERGVKLSGGQRQRIAIARAFLRNPKILMLDEATSSLDSKSEMVVQQALKNLMDGRTTLVIAHRLSTVMDADQIIFLDKGRITGMGTHKELLQNHSMYKEFATQQLRFQDLDIVTSS